MLSSDDGQDSLHLVTAEAAPKKLPTAKVVSEIMLSQVMGTAVTTGINTFIGLIPGAKHMPALAGNFLNGLSGYLNGRFVPGTLGAYLASPEVTREQKIDMLTRVAGLVATGITSAALLTVDDFFSIENPAVDMIAEATMRMAIGNAAGTVIEFAAKGLVSCVGLFSRTGEAAPLLASSDDLESKPINSSVGV